MGDGSWRRPPAHGPAAGLPAPGLLVWTVVLAVGLIGLGLTVHLEWMPGDAAIALLRYGGASFALGVLYAAASRAAAWRRLAMAPVAAAMNVTAVSTAVRLGRLAESAGLAFTLGLAGASALFGGLFALASVRLLAWRGGAAFLLGGGAAAGLVAFAAYGVLRGLSADLVPIASHLTVYWALWMVLTTAVVVSAARRAPAPQPLTARPDRGSGRSSP